MSARIIDKLPQFVDQVERRGARAVTQALILGASEASVLTPIDTSTLLNSQFRGLDVQQGKITGRVGYTAEYAGYVHDPAVVQNFTRPSAEKLFLTKGFENAKPNIDLAIKGALKA